MSCATDILLSRNDRDQYGSGGVGCSEAGAVRGRRVDGMWAVHMAVHDQLVARRGNAWLARYAEQTRHAVFDDVGRGHDSLCRLSTFNKMFNECNSFKSVLLYWLLTDKRFGLTLVEVPVAGIDAGMRKNQWSGGYMVSYGGGDRGFWTKDWRNEPKRRWVSGVGMVDRTPVPPVRPPKE